MKIEKFENLWCRKENFVHSIFSSAYPYAYAQECQKYEVWHFQNMTHNLASRMNKIERKNMENSSFVKIPKIFIQFFLFYFHANAAHEIILWKRLFLETLTKHRRLRHITSRTTKAAMKSNKEESIKISVREWEKMRSKENSFSTSKYLFRWKLKKSAFLSPQAENSQLEMNAIERRKGWKVISIIVVNCYCC